jgi:pimeloyl-ACP methyl ester carboxylesterase
MPDPVQARFFQVFPRSPDDVTFRRSHGQVKAVVLIHGLHVTPLKKGEACRVRLHSWQDPDSKLVDALANLADVYAFAYSQNVAVQEIGGVPCLAENIRRLRLMGYSRIVLVGHSAGGLIARQFIEDYPDSGVTKVIQICSPNTGTSWARLDPGLSKSQRSFVHSLSREGRADFLKDRSHKSIPPNVQFVCIVGDEIGLGDGVVSCQSQWPRDLQAQGIPVFPLRTTHFTVMRSPSGIQQIAELVQTFQPRWDPIQVALIRRELRAK